MVAPRGRRRTAGSERAGARDGDTSSAREDATGLVPDLLRRALGFGFSGLFGTEELLRKAFGDSVPREWVEFAAAQSDRARRELTERVAMEIQKKLDGVDLEQLLDRLLSSHALEVDARVRLVPRSGAARRARVRLTREDAT